MQDYQLTNQDITLTAYDFALVDGIDSTVQRLRQKLQLWTGEWFLNTAAGVPWLTNILGQAPSLQAISAVMNDAILTDDAVERLDKIELDYAGSTRRLSVDFTATLVTGESVTVSAIVGG